MLTQSSWPPTQLGLIGFVGSSRIRRGILEARFDQPERRWFDEKVFKARDPCFRLHSGDGDSWGTTGYFDIRRRAVPGPEFPVRYETSRMRGFQSESLEQLCDATVEMRDAAVEWRGAGAEVCDAAVLQGAQLGQSCVTQLCRRVMQLCSCVTHLRFKPELPVEARPAAPAYIGDYAAGLCRTQPRFPPAMRYALMERWNNCTHTFVFGFGEMTLTPMDYAAITGLRFTGPVPPLDARGEDPEYWRSFLNDRELSDAEVEQLRTRLEVEGIPLDSSAEDEDGSSSDDAPLSPPPSGSCWSEP
ncbi:hypothetical protein JCGZ_22084 [Jatropha curcas]|uniref:Aminotransferase-like plant mobile domain-containing protein n=1 Tax=Jatropha curcas TaxID=180498 RepID=A0A067K5B5_JATCU|nr:hypothetical protein JCGZ_22084 [Jatropha curcas]